MRWFDKEHADVSSVIIRGVELFNITELLKQSI